MSGKGNGRIRRLAALLMCAVLLFGAARADTVRFRGLEVDSGIENLDMGKIQIWDWDKFYEFLDQLPNLKHVDMYQSTPNVQAFETLNERYPDVTFSCTLHLGDRHVRTDVTAFSTLFAGEGRTSGHDECAMLRWCPNLYALDLGHNPVKNLDFLYDLPELRVLIVAICDLTDITPIASLKHLEYLEIFHNRIEDISCMAELPCLMDLNVVKNRIKDIRPVENIKSLKRLWIHLYNLDDKKAPDEALVRELQEALPDCHVDWESTSTAGGWRTHSHYRTLQRMFHNRVYEPFEDSDPENMPEPWRSEALKKQD